MYTAFITDPDDFTAFRTQARRLLSAGAEPADVLWTNAAAEASLFDCPMTETEKTAFVPAAFLPLAQAVACCRQPERWSLLYQAFWRLANGERFLLDQVADPLTCRLQRMADAVRRDAHRMTAFVRFRTVMTEDQEHFIAWYEPQHYVLRRVASFFVDRFASMRFTIMTPDLALHWDRNEQHFGPGVPRSEAAGADAMEACWTRYYAATFNPARNNPALLARHMPKRFWHNLPEAASIPTLTTEARQRTERMIAIPRAITGDAD